MKGGFVPNAYGFLSTYPPTQCGLATFSRALMRSLAESGDRVGIVRVTDTPVESRAPEVVGHLYSRARGGGEEAAAVLNTFDVAIVQHKYGIYGGHHGDQIVSVLDHVRVPKVVVLHTVLDSPTAEQAQLLLRITDASDAVVTLTVAAQRRLVGQYRVDPSKVHLIRHGATVHEPTDTDTSRIVRRPLILTWGLLGPGMGIEWAIDGLHLLRHLRPLPAYIVAGQTHPRVHQEHGESYRLQLGQRARIVGVAHLFRTIGSCLDDAALTRLIHRADVVLLPYDSLDQAASAVLAEAVAAGKPVVATAFPHAVELLSSGAGLLVHHFDGTAVGEALHRVLTEPGLAYRMAMEAARLAPMFSWTVAADHYRSLGKRLLRDWSVLEPDSTETVLSSSSPAIG